MAAPSSFFFLNEAETSINNERENGNEREKERNESEHESVSQKTLRNIFLVACLVLNNMEDEGDKKRVIDDLRDRMTGYEATSKVSLSPETPWIVRLDGHKFSNWAKYAPLILKNRSFLL